LKRQLLKVRAKNAPRIENELIGINNPLGGHLNPRLVGLEIESELLGNHATFEKSKRQL